MQFDLLLNPGRFAWAINCWVEEDTVRIGALYLEPDVPTPNIRLQSGGDIFEAILPEELLRQENAQRAWNITLPLTNE